MIEKVKLSTKKNTFYPITGYVEQAVKNSGIKDGLCIVFCPHTTAGITINENADPDVVTDMMLGLEKAYPDRAEFKHMEGNSAAHLRSSALGHSTTVAVEGGKLNLGMWQGIYFCEFDGPRDRHFYVKAYEDSV